jgi:hypothetical protein
MPSISRKFKSRKENTNQLLLFLPEISRANFISIIQAKTRKGNPISSEISVNLPIDSGET